MRSALKEDWHSLAFVFPPISPDGSVEDCENVASAAVIAAVIG
jgi:hypothetical protein